VELATFTDTHNATSQVTQATDYTASVSWGDGVFSPTNVTVTADTDPADPNGFVVTASSTGPITNPDELIATQIQYASTSSYHGRPASLGEPVVSITPAVAGLYAVPVSVSQMNLYWTLNASNATSIEVARSDDGGAYATLAATAGGSATMFTDTTVSEGHTYSYEIRAVQPIGDSAYSDPAVATTYAVQGLVATAASTTEIDLAWLNLSSDPAATVDVQRAPFGTSDFTTIAAGLSAGTSSYSDLTGLSEGTHWAYQVLLHEPGMGNLATLSDPADTWTLPAAATSLTVTSTASGGVDLSWANGSASSPSFYVARSDDGGPFNVIDAVDPGNTTYSDKSVSDGIAYNYEVAAVNDGGGTFNGLNAVATVTPLLAPSGLAATAVGATEVDLSWQNNSASASGLTIERSTNDTGHFSILAQLTDPSVSSYNDISTVAGTHYFYFVEATKAAASLMSAPSNQPDATTIPPTPTGPVVTTASPTELDLRWNAATGSTGYQIEREAPGGVWESLSIPDPTATSYDDSGLWEGVQYGYRVSAYNATGTSAPTDSVSATTPQTVPTAPSNLQAVTLSSSAVQLVWTNNANNETGFAIDTSPDASTWTQVGSTDPGTTTFTYGGQSPGATLSYRVRAVNSVGDAASYSASATTSPAPEPALLPPAPPGDLPVFAWTHGGNVTVSWDAPLVSYDSQHLPAGFNVYAYRMTGGVGTLVAQTSVTGAATGSATITGLTADYGVYNFAVTAYNAAGESDPTYIGLQGLFADTISAPATLSASVSGTTVNYTWTDPEPPTDGNTVAPFLEYSVDGTNWLGVTSSAGLAAGTLTMPAGCDCYLRLYRYHTDGTVSDYSNVVHVAAATPLASPSSLTATPAEGGVQLDWTAGDPADYRQMLERSDDGGASFHLIAQPSGTSYLDSTTDPGTTYEYRLRDALFPEFSFDYSIPLPGYSPYSDAVTATAPAAPVAVSGILSAVELGPDRLPQDGYFAFTRTMGLDRAETVSFTIDNSASDAATPGEEYQTLSGTTVNFAPGQSAAIVAIIPRWINRVEGAKSVTIELDNESNGNPILSTGQIEIANTDTAIAIRFNGPTDPNGNHIIDLNNNDSDNNGVSDLNQTYLAQADSDLVAVNIVYPVLVPSGTVFTLSTNASRLRFWDSPNKDNAILGDNGTAQWVVGPGAPTTVYAEAIDGSDSLGDTNTMLAVGPVTPPSPADSGGPATRSVQAQTTERYLRITESAPIARDATAGGPNNIMVGQRIAVIASAGPAALFNGSVPTWTVPANTVKGYTTSLHTGRIIQFADADLHQTSMGVYWIDGSFDGTRSALTIIWGGLTRRGDFIVHKPRSAITTAWTADVPRVQIGKNGVGDQNVETVHFGSNNSPGITIGGTVTTGTGGGGEIGFIQLSKLDSHFVQVSFSPPFHLVFNKLSTDGSFADDGDPDGSGLYNPSKRVGDSATENVSMEDSPKSGLSSPRVEVNLFSQFYTTLMYRPSGVDSIWVPLKIVYWSWNARVQNWPSGWKVILTGAGGSTMGTDWNEPPQWEDDIPRILKVGSLPE
ncbi:MAG: cbhB, partial [Phycisphaerales bacterium]|nr:cbhB [Phycisphaerales bacterium]